MMPAQSLQQLLQQQKSQSLQRPAWGPPMALPGSQESQLGVPAAAMQQAQQQAQRVLQLRGQCCARKPGPLPSQAAQASTAQKR